MKPIRSIFCYTLVALCSCTFLFSCKKDKNNTAGGITYTGVPTVGNTLTFHYPFPSGATYSWQFEAPYSSGDRDPRHTLYDTGLLTVTLHVNSTTLTKNIYVYGIGCTGITCVSDTLSFSTLPTGTHYLWNFGDGATSTDKAPQHSYGAVGTYSTSVTIDDAPTINQVVSIFNDPVYTSQITGNRTCQYRLIEDWSGGAKDTTNSTVTFSVTYINPITVSVFGTTLTYSPSLSNDSLLAYTYNYSNMHNTTKSIACTLYFNHVSNTIKYYINKEVGEGLDSYESYISQ